MKMFAIWRMIRRFVWFVAVGLLILTLALAWGFPTKAQLLPDLSVSADEVRTAPNIPTFNRGNLDIAPVFLDGKVVGSISSFIQLESELDDGQTTFYEAASRSQLIHSKLQKYLQTMLIYSQEILYRQGISRVEDRERELRNQLLVEVLEGDGSAWVSVTFPQNTDLPEIIYTVTQADVARIRFGSSEPVDIAQIGAVLVEDALLQAWRERQPPTCWPKVDGHYSHWLG